MGALKSPHCHNGHAMSGDNLYFRKDGTRECRQCSRDRQRKAARMRGAKARRKPDGDFESPPSGDGYQPTKKADAQRRYAPVEDI